MICLASLSSLTMAMSKSRCKSLSKDGLGFRFQGLGFGGLGFRAQGLGFRGLGV